MAMNWRGALGAVAADTSAVGGSRYAPYFCIHAYDANGVTPTSGNAAAWTPVADLTSRYGKEAWLTETSGVTGSTDWEHAINWASFFYSTLKYGKLSVYVHHYVAISTVGASYNYMLEGDTKYPWYYAARSFWYFIRKGAVQIDAASNNTSHAAPLAFAHPDNRTLTLVFVNPTGETVQATLSGPDLPQSYRRHLTASGQNCVDMGTVSAGSISLPPSSITTLVADNYDFTVTAAPPPRARAADRAHLLPGRESGGTVYSLDGRRGTQTRVAQGTGRPAGLCVRATGNGRAMLTAW
jgi:hypothetical protein